MRLFSASAMTLVYCNKEYVRSLKAKPPQLLASATIVFLLLLS